MGVALIINTCVPLDFSISCKRCCTPKRCCSSITTNPSCLKVTLCSINAWVPITKCTAPLAISCCNFFFALLCAVKSSTRIPIGSSNACIVWKCWRESNSVGAINAACVPASIACNINSNATIVLPLPTSPCNNRTIRWPCCISAPNSRTTSCWPLVSVNGKLVISFFTNTPSPFNTCPLSRVCFRRASASANWCANNSSYAKRWRAGESGSSISADCGWCSEKSASFQLANFCFLTSSGSLHSG